MNKSFALTGRKALDCLTQGVAMGYRDIGLSARPSIHFSIHETARPYSKSKLVREKNISKSNPLAPIGGLCAEGAVYRQCFGLVMHRSTDVALTERASEACFR